MFPVILPLSFHLRSLSAVFVRRCTRTAQAVRPIRAKDFHLNQAREYAAPAAGDVRRFRRGNQKGRHLRFLPSWDSRFPLLVSPAKIGERRPLRNWSTTVGLLQRVFLRLFAVHRQRTATQVGNLRQTIPKETGRKSEGGNLRCPSLLCARAASAQFRSLHKRKLRSPRGTCAK